MRTVNPINWDTKNDVLIYGHTEHGNYMVGEVFGRQEAAQNEIEDLLPIEEVERVAKLLAAAPRLYQTLELLLSAREELQPRYVVAIKEALALVPGGLDGFSE